MSPSASRPPDPHSRLTFCRGRVDLEQLGLVNDSIMHQRFDRAEPARTAKADQQLAHLFPFLLILLLDVDEEVSLRSLRRLLRRVSFKAASDCLPTHVFQLHRFFAFHCPESGYSGRNLSLLLRPISTAIGGCHSAGAVESCCLEICRSLVSL